MGIKVLVCPYKTEKYKEIAFNFPDGQNLTQNNYTAINKVVLLIKICIMISRRI